MRQTECKFVFVGHTEVDFRAASPVTVDYRGPSEAVVTCRIEGGGTFRAVLQNLLFWTEDGVVVTKP